MTHGAPGKRQRGPFFVTRCLAGDDRVDTDYDLIPNACDECDVGMADTDRDGIPDSCDPCPYDSPDDTDGDWVCNSLDTCFTLLGLIVLKTYFEL